MVNRLCSDVYVVDDSLPFQANICLAAIFNLVGVLAITMFSLPFLIPFVILLFVAYYFIQVILKDVYVYIFIYLNCFSVIIDLLLVKSSEYLL